MAKKKKSGTARAAGKPAKKTAATTRKRRGGAGAVRIGTPKLPVKGKTSEIVFTTLAVGALGVLGYFGWKYYKKKKGAANVDIDEAIKKIDPQTLVLPVKPVTPTPVKPTRKKTATGRGNDDFPLQKGSRGERVMQLQNALIAKYGKTALPKFGADGDFGSETATALKRNNLPSSIDESTFNVLVQASTPGAGDTTGHAKKIYDALKGKNFSAVLSLLRGIHTKEQYQQVSNSFMPLRLGGVRQTLVNGVLSTFPGTDQKHQIRLEFSRMGLRYDGSKWSLSGFDGRSIVTVENATVWITPNKSATVPANMVLGSEVAQRLDYTLFENNNRYFLVKTQSVKYL